MPQRKGNFFMDAPTSLKPRPPGGPGQRLLHLWELCIGQRIQEHDDVLDSREFRKVQVTHILLVHVLARLRVQARPAEATSRVLVRSLTTSVRVMKIAVVHVRSW